MENIVIDKTNPAILSATWECTEWNVCEIYKRNKKMYCLKMKNENIIFNK